MELPLPESELVERAARNTLLWEPGTPRWAAMKNIFGVGSTYAGQICEAFGIDADELKPNPISEE